MKTQAINVVAIAAVAGFLASGCFTQREVVRAPVAIAPTGPIVVSSEPPPPRQEVVGVAPSAEKVWTPGYWSFTNNRWVWMPGHWETRPSPAVVWVPGHWHRRVDGWVWTPGYWR